MRGAYVQVRDQVVRQLGVEVVPSNYPPSTSNVVLANLAQVTQLGFIGATIFANSIFPAIGMRVPEFFESMGQNKFGACTGAWFVGNTIQQNLLSTGAFEIYYGGEKIFSKLESGRMPRLNFLMEEIGARSAGRQGRLRSGKGANQQRQREQQRVVKEPVEDDDWEL